MLRPNDAHFVESGRDLSLSFAEMLVEVRGHILDLELMHSTRLQDPDYLALLVDAGSDDRGSYLQGLRRLEVAAAGLVEVLQLARQQIAAARILEIKAHG